MQAYHFVLFEVLCSFAPEIFSHTAALRPQEYLLSFKAEKQGVGKKLGAKPTPFLWNAAQELAFFFAFCYAGEKEGRGWKE